jgi:hypothetical protein
MSKKIKVYRSNGQFLQDVQGEVEYVDRNCAIWFRQQFRTACIRLDSGDKIIRYIKESAVPNNVTLIASCLERISSPAEKHSNL